MFGSNVLEVAIGLIFIYLFLSVICSSINEAIASLMNQRAKNLFEGVKNLLNDPDFTGLAQFLYNHGLVTAFMQNAANDSKPNRWPSYVPPATFSLALIDLLGAQGIVAAAHGDLLDAAEKADQSYYEALSALKKALAQNKTDTPANKKILADWEGARQALDDAAEVVDRVIIDDKPSDTATANLATAQSAYDTATTALDNTFTAIGLPSLSQSLLQSLKNALVERDARRKLLCNAAIQAYQPIKIAKEAQQAYEQAKMGADSAPGDSTKQRDTLNKKLLADRARAAVTSAQEKAFLIAKAAVKMHDAKRAAMLVGNDTGNLDRVNKASDRLEEALALTRIFSEECKDPLNNIYAAVDKLPPGHTKETLFVLIAQTKRDLDKAETTAGEQINRFNQHLSTWYNNSMDRVSGWYKRWTQKVLLVLAFAIVFSINADTIMLIQQLTKQGALRSSLVTAAQDASKSAHDPNEKSDFADSKSYKLVLGEAEKLKLPLGWSMTKNDPNNFPCSGFDHDKKAKVWQEIGRHMDSLLLKIVGLLLSAFAVCLGAPFWFDILSKFVNIRSAGTPPGGAKKGTPAAT